MQYAITFDILESELARCEVGNPIGELKELDAFMTKGGVSSKCEFGYLLNSKYNVVHAVLLFQNALRKFGWLRHCVDNAHILHIKDIDDLTPVIEE